MNAVVFANELQRRIDTQPLVKGKITSSSLHPGVIYTGLSRETFFLWRYLFGFALKLVGKNVVQGSQTTLMAALAPSLKGKGGVYLTDCEVATPHADAVYTPGQKFPAGEKLWQVSGNLLNQRGIAVGVRQRPKPKAEEKKVCIRRPFDCVSTCISAHFSMTCRQVCLCCVWPLFVFPLTLPLPH